MCNKTRGRSQDKRTHESIKRREKARKLNEQANDFAKLVMGMVS